MTVHSYPWYIKDWLLSETRFSMTLEERGLYRDLLDQFCDQGSLPTDEKSLIKIAACEPREFKRAWPKVSSKFYKKEGRYYNRRAEEVVEHLLSQKELLSERGRAGAQAKHSKRLVLKQNSSTTQGVLNSAPPQPLPQPLPQPDKQFEKFWNAYPNQVNYEDACHAWISLWGTRITPGNCHEVMEGLERYKRSVAWVKDDGKWVPSPKTFLMGNEKKRGGMWKDFPPQANNGCTEPAAEDVLAFLREPKPLD